MFWDAPADYQPTETERDLAARWLPNAAQIAAALALLATLPAREEYVYVAIALPDKDHGIWTLGQPVEHVAGVWLGRDEASHAAALHLGTRPGQPSYAVVWRDGHAAAFEDFRGLFPDDPIGPRVAVTESDRDDHLDDYPPATTLPAGTVRLDTIPF